MGREYAERSSRDRLETIIHHYKEGNIHWKVVIPLILLHSASLYGAYLISDCAPETLLWAFFLYPLSGMGITAGAHRLWAHRSYEASFAVRLILMLCNSIACQGSIHHWVRDHRLHHKFSETETDPHNAQRGFFFAHMGWLCIKKDPKVLKAGREMDMSDVMEDPVVWFQKKCDPWLTLYMCLVMPAQVANFFWGESFLNGFFVPGALRYCFGLHGTFLVNSAAHIYGDHPYDSAMPPAENALVSWWALGEGWHNWHHKYPFDYACSEFGISSQFNPTKVLIDFFAMFGLVWGRKRATGVWRQARHRRDKVTTTTTIESSLQSKQQ